MDTYHVLVEESPDVFDEFPRSALIAICDQIQRSELPEKSREFRALFCEFNLEYFAGRLPEYEVRVVFDIVQWAGPKFDDGALATRQPELRRIFIRFTDRLPQMATVLIEDLACLTSDCNHDRYLEETRRLRKADAPVGNLQIDWGPSVSVKASVGDPL